MRPHQLTPAHTTGYLAELVCSNSMGSNIIDRGTGLLQNELKRMRSLLLECAEATALPAGGSLAVDREQFAALVTQKITHHPHIQLVHEEVKQIPDGPVIIASGPLTSPALSDSIQALTGQEHLFFYDAIAPIVTAESIDMHIAFRASRFERGQREEGDYINCPMEVDQYTASSVSFARPNASNCASSSRTCSKGSPGEPESISKAACRLRSWLNAALKHWLSGLYARLGFPIRGPVNSPLQFCSSARITWPTACIIWLVFKPT